MTTVVSANILFELDAPLATAALDQVLAGEPDLVALQEWYFGRLGLLHRHGDVRVATVRPFPAIPLPARSPRYHWVATVDGNVAGARADRYDVLEARSFLNIAPAPSERPERPFRTEPPRFVAVLVLRDRVEGHTVALLSYHLSSGVQSDGGYRADRPRLSARHRAENRHLEGLVADLQAEGHVVLAAGDSNFDGLTVAGLTSAWVGREDEPGTMGGSRKIDDVFGPGPARSVERIVTPSDHQAIVVTR